MFKSHAISSRCSCLLDNYSYAYNKPALWLVKELYRYVAMLSS